MPVRFDLDFERVKAALVYFAADPRVTGLDKYKAGKLLFLAEKYYVVRYASPLFGDDYRALRHGPVPQNTLDLLHELTSGNTNQPRVAALAKVLAVDFVPRYPQLRAKVARDLNDYSEAERDALEITVVRHGNKTFAELQGLTHEMPAWKNVWAPSPESDQKAFDIRYEDFFDEDSDAISGALEEMTGESPRVVLCEPNDY